MPPKVLNLFRALIERWRGINLRAFRLQRIHLLGIGLIAFGLTIIILPTGAIGTATYILHKTGIRLPVLGGAMMLGAVLAMTAQHQLRTGYDKRWMIAYLIGIAPWGLFTVASVFFCIEHGISATVSLANVLICGLLIYEAFDIHE